MQCAKEHIHILLFSRAKRVTKTTSGCSYFAASLVISISNVQKNIFNSNLLASVKFCGIKLTSCIIRLSLWIYLIWRQAFKLGRIWQFKLWISMRKWNNTQFKTKFNKIEFSWSKQAGNSRHSLSCFLGKESFLGLGLGLGFRPHYPTTPLLPVLLILVIEVGLCKRNNKGEMKAQKGIKEKWAKNQQ